MSAVPARLADTAPALDPVGCSELDRFARDMGFGAAFTRRARYLTEEL